MTATPSPALAALAAALTADAAAGVPPFGADSVKQARTLGPTATPLLLDRVRARGTDAFLALESLRLADPAAYAAQPAPDRATVYVAALRDATFWNAWGHPGGTLTDTARALIALGDPAVAALTPLLDDTRPAPSSGSQDATLSRANGTRICDYAWILIIEARKLDYDFSPSPADRDRAIAALRTRLQAP